MPEGDTLFRAAVTLRKALLGKRLTGFETDVEVVRNACEGVVLTGREVTLVEARGKNLLIRLGAEGEGSLTLRTHLRMKGSWHIYRPAEPWRKPTHYARVVLRTEEFVAICFSAPVVELLTERQLARHPDLTEIGPDAITDEFDSAEAFARLRRRPDLPIGVGLLNQRALSGVGNVYKSEVLFLKRVNPFLLIRELPDDVLMSLVEESHRLLQLNRGGGSRRTHFDLSEHARLWVYGRSGEPCRVCATRIKMRRQGMDGRSTYYCANCQGVEIQ